MSDTRKENDVSNVIDLHLERMKRRPATITCPIKSISLLSVEARGLVERDIEAMLELAFVQMVHDYFVLGGGKGTPKGIL